MAIDSIKMRDVPLPPDPQLPALDGSSKDPGHESVPENQPETVRLNNLPKAPVGDPLAASAMRAKINGATFPSIGTHADSKSDPAEGAAPDYAGLGETEGADIEALAFITMMDAAKSAQQDLKDIMSEVKAINNEKAGDSKDMFVHKKP